eukprot:TRINITY_DN24237_c0_g1_i3.p1 TRINITY_DN24237_c0_g1~~TRINITY_DN24237_c0_g1_i3.p1  ORF type:complete len:263 (+),score=72.48 TRINITY_DN24237_c0_g1_i3:951-1739(+)
MAKPWQLKRKVQTYLQPSVARIDGAASFRTYCTSRRACLVVGFKNAPMLAQTLKMLTPLLPEHRGVRAVSIDTSVWRVKLAKELADAKPKKKEGQKEQSSIMCFGRQEGKQSRGGNFLRVAEGKSVTPDVLTAFMQRCASGKGLISFKEAPQIAQQDSRPKPPPRPRPSQTPAPGPSTSQKTISSGGGAGKSKKAASASRKKPRPVASKKDKGGKMDRVGSRAKLEQEEAEEPLFTAVEDDEAAEEEEPEAEEEEDQEEIEL